MNCTDRGKPKWSKKILSGGEVRNILYHTLPFVSRARLYVPGRERHVEGERSRWFFSAASI